MLKVGWHFHRSQIGNVSFSHSSHVFFSPFQCLATSCCYKSQQISVKTVPKIHSPTQTSHKITLRRLSIFPFSSFSSTAFGFWPCYPTFVPPWKIRVVYPWPGTAFVRRWETPYPRPLPRHDGRQVRQPSVVSATCHDPNEVIIAMWLAAASCGWIIFALGLIIVLAWGTINSFYSCWSMAPLALWLVFSALCRSSWWWLKSCWVWKTRYGRRICRWQMLGKYHLHGRKKR